MPQSEHVFFHPLSSISRFFRSPLLIRGPFSTRNSLRGLLILARGEARILEERTPSGSVFSRYMTSRKAQYSRWESDPRSLVASQPFDPKRFQNTFWNLFGSFKADIRLGLYLLSYGSLFTPKRLQNRTTPGGIRNHNLPIPSLVLLKVL